MTEKLVQKYEREEHAKERCSLPCRRSGSTQWWGGWGSTCITRRGEGAALRSTTARKGRGGPGRLVSKEKMIEKPKKSGTPTERLFKKHRSLDKNNTFGHRIDANEIRA